MALFQDFQDFYHAFREQLPFALEHFDREGDSQAVVSVKREVTNDLDKQAFLQDVIRDFLPKYIDLIRRKAPGKNISLDDFKKQVFPQEVYHYEDVLLVPFFLPISFQHIAMTDSSVHFEFLLVDDLIEQNAVVLE